MKKHSVLHQHLYSFDCPTEELARVREYAINLPWDEVGKRGEGAQSGRSYIHPTSTLHTIEELLPLHNWIESQINAVRVDVGWRKETVRGLRISQSWLNRSDTGELHHRHHHPLSVLSAILYITEPTLTSFYVPSIYALPRVLAPDKKSGQQEVELEFKGYAGQLVVFPSTLKHSVGPNLEPFARFTLSANTWFHGPIGRIEELAYIPEA